MFESEDSEESQSSQKKPVSLEKLIKRQNSQMINYNVYDKDNYLQIAKWLENGINMEDINKKTIRVID